MGYETPLGGTRDLAHTFLFFWGEVKVVSPTIVGCFIYIGKALNL